MKSLFMLFVSLACSCMAYASSPDAPKLFDVTPRELVETTQVGDSVFYYTSDELLCPADADEEAPCLGQVDHWDSVCFKGDMELLCPVVADLFKHSSEQLMEQGAEEDVELLSCSVASGIPVLSFNLLSYHGGPNVLVKDKMIPLCPIFFQ